MNARTSQLWQRFRDPSKEFKRSHAEQLFNIISEQQSQIEQLEAPVREVMAQSEDFDGVNMIAYVRAIHKKMEGQRKHIAALEAKLRASNEPVPGHGNATTDADRQVGARTAGEAPASDGDSACPAVPASAQIPRDNYGRVEPPHGYAYRYPSVTGGTVISFDRMPKRQALEAIPYWLGSPVPELPATGSLKLDNDRQVFFYEQDHYYLSNFSAFNLRLGGGLTFPTAEHAYHWHKFPESPDLQCDIRRAPSAHEAFKLAEREKNSRREDWDEIKVDTMRALLRMKVQQHEYVRRKLLETGDRELIENSWRDPFWGWGEKRDGQNMLGKLWMEIRAELRRAREPQS